MAGKTKMPDALATAIATLRDAEARLRDDTARAATVGAYDSVIVISGWAKTLQALLSQVNNDDLPRVAAESAVFSSMSRAKIHVVKSHRERGNGKERGTTSSLESCFTRDADFLVKTALARESGAQYEHRAPEEVIFAAANCLSEWRPSQKLLTAERLLGDCQKRVATAVSYQLYVALGWLTQLGLVRKHGRSGYSVPSPATLPHDVRRAWTELERTKNKSKQPG